mmetsp:Transcript_12224/g.49086  ORF Transcript_12224/g.49086 Transcript_12224/m.49086 type:complete len:113 (+) Transcript_12224:51-389(+)
MYPPSCRPQSRACSLCNTAQSQQLHDGLAFSSEGLLASNEYQVAVSSSLGKIAGCLPQTATDLQCARRQNADQVCNMVAIEPSNCCVQDSVHMVSTSLEQVFLRSGVYQLPP